MTAHIALPEIEPDPRLPATLSPRVLTSLLREDLRFPGLIITDALDMQGVLGAFGEGEVAVRAVEAGADVLLFAKPETMHPALKAAVASGRLSPARIEQSAPTPAVLVPATAVRTEAGTARVFIVTAGAARALLCQTIPTAP